MPLNDLNLEFEDEEDIRAKKSDALHVDVDLEFQTHNGPVKKPVAPSAPVAVAAERPVRAEGVVRPIQSARSATPGPVPNASPAARVFANPQPQVSGATALKMEPIADVDAQELVDLREKMRQVEINAEVKVQVAEFKTDYLTEMLSDMKLMEHQIGQLLVRINAKHPDLKNEALMIKKILADYTSKKRK